MTTLGQLSEARIGSGLQAIIDEWAPGKPLPDQLLVGRDMALATLQKYRPGLAYSGRQADDQIREIEAWADRNQAALSAIMASTTEQLPDALQLEMGAERAQAFIVGSFTQAAAGIGAWASGAVADASQGGRVTERWARADAQQRLQMFALIIKLDRDGALASIFVAPQGASGFGAIPFWFIAVVLVVIAAAIVTAVVLVRRLDLNNKLLRDLCQEKLKSGDKAAFETCVEAAKGLQTNPLEDLPKQILYAAIAGATVYAVARFAVPMAMQMMIQRPARGGRALPRGET